MRIVDSQIHLVTRHSADRPWRSTEHMVHGHAEFGAERILAEMDAAGVERAVLVPTSSEGDRNDTCLAAAARHPKRFAVMGKLDLSDPTNAAALATWRATPGMLGLRVTMRTGPAREWLRNGTLDWLWPAAERAGVPLYLLLPSTTLDLEPVARRHPALRLTVDHAGLFPGMSGDEIDRAIDGLVHLARYHNIAIKVSCLPAIAHDPYPFTSVHGIVRRLVDAFGPQRVFWGSDLTRSPCTLAEAVAMFTEEMPFLSASDLDWIMGRGVEQWLGWTPPTTGMGEVC